jgi:hypothetical protein
MGMKTVTATCSQCGRAYPAEVPDFAAAGGVDFAVCPACGEQEVVAEGGVALSADPFRDSPERIFPLGRILITRRAGEACAGHGSPLYVLGRHVLGDWGKAGNFHDITLTDAEKRTGCLETSDDGKLNKISVYYLRGRVHSAYTLGGKEVWVMTELDGGRAQTTVLLADEY